jgi:hypothetical protein
LLLDNRRRAQAAALAAAADLYANWSANQGKDTSGTAKASALSTTAAIGSRYICDKFIIGGGSFKLGTGQGQSRLIGLVE